MFHKKGQDNLKENITLCQKSHEVFFHAPLDLSLVTDLKNKRAFGMGYINFTYLH